MHKLTSDALRVPSGGWIEVGDSGAAEQSAAMGPRSADGACGAASWALRIDELEPELRHLPREWLYRAPLPRTKLTQPLPAGELRRRADAGRATGASSSTSGAAWSATTGAPSTPSAGSGCTACGFEGAPEAWLDVALGRIRIGGRLTPWVANGMLSLDGRRTRLGGLGRRGLSVRESARGLHAAPAGRARNNRRAAGRRARLDGGGLALWRSAWR